MPKKTITARALKGRLDSGRWRVRCVVHRAGRGPVLMLVDNVTGKPQTRALS